MSKYIEYPEAESLGENDVILASVDNGDTTRSTKHIKYSKLQALYGDAGNVVENESFTEVKTDRDFEESPGSFRPIYTKTFDIGTLPNNTTKTVAHNLSDVSVFCSCTGSAVRASDKSSFTMPFAYNGTSIVSVYSDTTNISISTLSDRTAYSGVVTLEYTKTTDTPTATPRNVKIGSGGNFTKDLFLLDTHISTNGQAIPNDTLTTVLYDTVQIDKNEAYTSSTGEWIATKDCDININCGCHMENIADQAWAVLYITVNGDIVAAHNEVSGGSRHVLLTTSKALRIASGDTVAVKVQHVSGATVNIYADTTVLKQTYFQITELIAGTVDPDDFITGTVDLENDEYICDGTESSVTIDVSNFDSDDLELLCSLKTNLSGDDDDVVKLIFNDDTSASYDSTILLYATDNSSITDPSQDGLNLSYVPLYSEAGGSIADTHTQVNINIINYKNNIVRKNIAGTFNLITSSFYTGCISAIWKKTDPITKLTFTPKAGTQFAAGSRIKVYGKKTETKVITEGEEVTVWTKIRETDISADTTSFTWDGLDGDEAGQYKIVTSFKGVNGTANDLILSFNGDTTSSNYDTQRLYGAGTSVVAGKLVRDGIICGSVQNTGEYGSSEVFINAKSGKQRWVRVLNGRNDGNLVSEGGIFEAMWLDTVNNISTVVLTSIITDGIGAGSHFELWAPRKVRVGEPAGSSSDINSATIYKLTF